MSLQATTSSTHIHSLPDLSLLSIFDHLPIRDVLSLKFVCRKWSTLEYSANCRVKSLALVFGTLNATVLNNETFKLNFNHSEKQKKNLLSGLEVNPSTVGQVLTSFRNVTTLELASEHPSFFALILSKWPSKLTSLKIWCSTINLVVDMATASKLLFQPINALTSLKKLSLHLSCTFLELQGRTPAEIDLPILGQLEEFTFFTLDTIALIWKSIVQYSQPNLKISLRSAIAQDSESFQAHLAQLPPQLCGSFRRLPMDHGFASFSQLGAFCQRFTSLTALHLMLPHGLLLSYQDVLPLLASLTQLTELHTNLDYLEDELSPDKPSLPRLPSIRIFAIYEVAFFPFCISKLHFPQTFPSIVSIDIFSHYCPSITCFRCASSESCLKKFLTSLKSCPDFGKVSFPFDRKYYQITKAQLQELELQD